MAVALGGIIDRSIARLAFRAIGLLPLVKTDLGFRTPKLASAPAFGLKLLLLRERGARVQTTVAPETV